MYYDIYYKNKLVYEGKGGALANLCDRISDTLCPRKISKNLIILIHVIICSEIVSLDYLSLKELKIFTALLIKTMHDLECEGYFKLFPEEIAERVKNNISLNLPSYAKSETIKLIRSFQNLIDELETISKQSTINYKNERILKWDSATLSVLSEKILFFAEQQKIDPRSSIIQFIESWEYNDGGNFIDLNSREEVQQLYELIDLSITSLTKENYYKCFEYKKNGEILNQVLDNSNYLLKRTQEIAAHEWADDNLLMGRANTLQPLKEMLLYFAYEKNIDSDSQLMNFLYKLYNDRAKDIEIYSKEELVQFIELLELAIQALINNDYFRPDIIEDGIPFSYLQHNYQTFVGRLKEIAADWNNAISDEWKQEKLITKVEPVPKPEVKITDQPKTLKAIIIDLIKSIGLFILLSMITIAILLIIAFTAKYISNIYKL